MVFITIVFHTLQIACVLGVIGWTIFEMQQYEEWLWLLKILAESAQIQLDVTHIWSYMKACEGTLLDIYHSLP